MRHTSLAQLLRIHDSLLESSGGAAGIRDLGRLEAAIAQPLARFGEHDLYPTLVEKAAALAFSIIQGHPFIDGNKRAGHAAMAIFLRLNGQEIVATTEDQEALILGVASGTVSREGMASWLAKHTEDLE